MHSISMLRSGVIIKDAKMRSLSTTTKDEVGKDSVITQRGPSRAAASKRRRFQLWRSITRFAMNVPLLQ